MTDDRTSRLAAASGLVLVPVVLVLGTVRSDADAALAGEVLALVLLVPFLAGLAAHLRARGAAAPLALTVFGAGLTGLVVKLAGVVPDALARREALGPEVGPAFERLGEISFVLSQPPLGLALAATAAAALATGALPRWLAWSAAVLAPLLVANGFALGAEVGLAFVLFLLWTFAASAVLLRAARRGARARP